MLRARFFQDTYLVDNNTVRRYNQESDIKLETAIELYINDKIDILNPYLNQDLLENINLYEKDWEDFCRLTKREGV